MNKYTPYTVLCATLLFFSCSKAPINNDPVIGIWTNTAEADVSGKTDIQTEYEWIFNDAYLGRHHQYEGSTITVETDFRWEKEEGVYTISYPGTDFPDDTVELINSTLQSTDDGDVLATREN